MENITLDTQRADMVGKAKALLDQAREIAVMVEPGGEKMTEFHRLMGEVKALRERVSAIDELEKAQGAFDMAASQAHDSAVGRKTEKKNYKTLGEFAVSVHSAAFRNVYDGRLQLFSDSKEGRLTDGEGWIESTRGRQTKDLVESVGASGGFLVPPEMRSSDLLRLPSPTAVVRPRATIVPMRRRQIQWPVLDQTNSTAGRPAWFGGVRALWTEEAAEKTETDPQFRQIDLVAHKLVCITEASDELLEDSAISLEALLAELFTGARSWYEENAFMVGTGAGQPQGVITAGATFRQARAAVNAVGIVDIINMLEHSYGSPVWVISKSLLPSLLQLNGPAANPSYVFIPNARDGMPGTLFGYPVIYNEHCPLLGAEGDIGLYDFRYYLIGDRQADTIMVSKHDKFRYDMTVWRNVARVDGQPWLSQPVYLQDGTTQISPFVILDDATGS